MRQHWQQHTNSQRSLKWLLALACLAFCALFSYAALVSATTQNPLTPSERRGKQIYTRGTSPSGQEILAYLGEASLEVPASAMSCANCHGLEGQGKPEGGITPSNLTWEAVTKPYGVTHADGRRHPPYTERGLELAITRGLDPAGHRLMNVMPRYVMSKEDLADLILYLKRLGKDRDPGISETALVIGATVPNGALAEMGQAVKAVTTAFFAELNSQGGIYNRRVELKLIETAETPAMPMQPLPSRALGLHSPRAGAEELARRLRTGPVRAIGRIERDQLLLDLRTVHDEELTALAAIIRGLARPIAQAIG